MSAIAIAICVNAGTRYRKRGLNVDGHVGNDVETEQLLCDDSTRPIDGTIHFA